jgi:hypothetical protein
VGDAEKREGRERVTTERSEWRQKEEGEIVKKIGRHKGSNGGRKIGRSEDGRNIKYEEGREKDIIGGKGDTKGGKRNGKAGRVGCGALGVELTE